MNTLLRSLASLNSLRSLLLICIASISCISLPACALMQQDSDQNEQAQKRLTGTWTLIGAPEIRADGSRGETFGANPQGLLIIDDTGRYSLQIYKAERTKFANGDKRKGSESEFRAAALDTSAHYGRCFIDVERNVLIFRIEHASFPNWDGSEQARQFELKADVLSYRVPAGASGNGTTAISIWKKIR
ncbi:lipocalin-like domain-containing protein [Undibacterium sp. Ji50W]|uniref:lipocalin-like domain-containing protein n=1 Tax=Undibacterium sp. Ji50W TaxID=3413041 RepID=UPI003BF300D3